MDQQFSGTLHLCSHKDHVQYALNKFTLAPMISAGGQTTTKFRIDYGHKKYYDIHPEDVINVQRSSLIPPNLRILAFPMRNEKRIQVDGYLILDEKEGQNGKAGIDIDALRNAILKWAATGRSKQPPHHPFAHYERKILVILNPFSGQQKAEEMWRRDVEPLWHQAGLQIEVVITEHAGHAVELAQQIDLDRIGMIALGSGDGLVSEVLHGLLANKTGTERVRALRLPILHLPMGTGNALASSICYQANEPFSPRGSFCPQMALMAIAPVHRRLRLHRVEFSNGQRKTMFLSLSWGLMADIDIGSERFRFLGMARLHLEAFIRVARLPSVARYRAKISYLPVGNEMASKELMEKLRYRVNEERHNFGPDHFEDGEIIEEGENVKNDEPNVEMPPLNEPVPSTWKTIEGEFCFVTVAALSHLGSDLPYLPSARLHDPILFLTFVQWPKLNSRFHMAQILLSIDTSDHLADPAFEIIPCLACRIEPESRAGGWLALDGEAMDWQQPATVVNNKLDNKQDSTMPPPSFQVGVSNECATVVGRRERQRGQRKEDNDENAENE